MRSQGDPGFTQTLFASKAIACITARNRARRFAYRDLIIKKRNNNEVNLHHADFVLLFGNKLREPKHDLVTCAGHHNQGGEMKIHIVENSRKKKHE